MAKKNTYEEGKWVMYGTNNLYSARNKSSKVIGVFDTGKQAKTFYDNNEGEYLKNYKAVGIMSKRRFEKGE